MLEAKKNKTFEKIFALYNTNLLRRKFSSFNVSGSENFQDISLPCLVYANHSSWWDGLAAFKISSLLNLDSYLMMEEKQLRKYKFFRKLGAFSVVRENPRQSLQSINYAFRILNEKPGRKVWIFPQGEILPNDVRPLKFYHGLSHTAKRLGNCAVMPVALRFEFLGKFKPEIFVKIGKPEYFLDDSFGKKQSLSDKFAETLSEMLDEIRFDILNNNLSDYKNII